MQPIEVMRGLKLILLTAISILSMGSLAGAQDWILTIRNLGIDVSPQDYVILHQFENQGNTERQIVAVNLVELALIYPKQAAQWIDGASVILEKTYNVSTKNESFKRTRTSYLQSVMAVLWSEGNRPKTLSGDSMVSVFQKYFHSPKKLYDATAIFYVYSNLVNKGLATPGSSALKEAAIQFKIAKYKNKMDVAVLSDEEETQLRNPPRRIASIAP